MVDTRKRRAAVFLFFLLALGAMLLFCGRTEEKTCMDVPVLSEREQAALGTYGYRDLSRELRYNGQQAAVDLDRSTVYIALDVREDTMMEALPGSLHTRNPAVRLSFAPDEAFADLPAAVARGHVFKLNVVYGFRRYMQYDLVFTTLPVLRLDGAFLEKNEKDRDVFEGTFCLWTPKDPDTNSFSVKTSNVRWHVRGGWSSTLEKTPFKLNLKKKTGTGKNLSLAGLGADDDWILNPMNLDDTKLKEKLFMGLWNQRAEQVSWNEKMSEGEYVEVVINQEYWGLFQLQRRIDRKFLELDEEAVLLKGYGQWDASAAEEAYEIVHSGLPDTQTYALLEDFFNGEDGNILNMDNFLDVNLFIQWAAARDNTDYRNMFYLLKKEGDSHLMYLLPWDTDMSWGTIWEAEAGGFVYDFAESGQSSALRMEYEWMKEYHPDLDRQLAERWLELREGLLTLENMSASLERTRAVLDASGARMRDTDRWGLYYAGEDSLENLYKSLEARLEWVDAYYGPYLQ